MRSMRLWFYFVLSAVVFFADMATKRIIVKELNMNEQISVIGDFFLITSYRNTGAAFSLLEDQRVFFLIVTVIVTTGLIWYMAKMRKSGRAILLTGLGMVLGGALGNFSDRARTGEVVDFLQFNFGSYTFPIFNVADMGICIGVGLILLDAFIGAREEKAAQLSSSLAAGPDSDRKERIE
ncbi:lipoprotein signal peptidase [Paenibacillus curdlanolyticus YK9]|uniref:Lipoprotein signal peptidase n=1 Tax=Paenibacillus curdlanolyticus YK9 TaxID=717606 RepID=E0I3H9_9BACL|nr:signal peptidase II [Paenibacillus curdlanolyticus]EFM12843.1 lipoprotein signal peptidase [Paenibacillus curdlanolyticus YK9]